MKFLRDIIVPILVGLVVFALFRVSVGSFKVYGLSMWPTIDDSEYILVTKVSYLFNEPQHGDIIVFRSPQDPNTDLIKRIIAIPGDTIEIKDGTVLINNSPLSEPYIFEAPKYNYLKQEIDANQYFVLGDNRNNSADSHKGWTVPHQNIIGKAWITYWPPQRWRLIEHYALNLGTQVAKVADSIFSLKILCLTR